MLGVKLILGVILGDTLIEGVTLGVDDGLTKGSGDEEIDGVILGDTVILGVTLGVAVTVGVTLGVALGNGTIGPIGYTTGILL